MTTFDVLLDTNVFIKAKYKNVLILASFQLSDCINTIIPVIAQKPSEPENEDKVQILLPGIKSRNAQRLPMHIPKIITLINDLISFFNTKFIKSITY